MARTEYDLSVQGLDQLIRDLEKFERALEMANDAMVQELAEIGYNEIVTNAYDAKEIDQVDDIITLTQTIKRSDKTTSQATVYNESPRATFAEFGYGMIGEQAPYAHDDFINSRQAGYSGYNLPSPAKKEDVFGETYWVYRDSYGDKHHSYGEQPSNIFYNAGQAVKNALPSVIQRKFENLWSKK